MEQTKEKYYDLIVNLITSHKKFAGLEDNLEDVIKEVYSGANTILETVDDENILESYLQKIVSTAIITISKKLNINNRKSTSFQIISNKTDSIVEQSENIETEEEEETEREEEFNSNYNADSTDNLYDTNLIFETENDIETMETSSQDLQINTFEETDNETEEIVEFNTTAIEENELQANSESENDLQLNLSEVDIHLVDNLINGTVLNSESESSISNNENLDVIYPQNKNEEYNDDIFKLDLITENDNQNEESELQYSSVQSDDDEIINLSEMSENLSTSYNLKEYKLPSYEKFLTPPQKPCGIESKYIFYELEHIQKKFPETNVKEVFKLKYIDNLSVQEIADNIGVASDAIVAILADVVNFVKDL